MKETRKRVGIWIRVSTEDQVRGESPEHHEKRARLYAEAKEWNVIEVYRLDALSGKTVKEYPETKRMLADVKAGHITGLIFSKLARLARNTRELLEFAEIFRDLNADLISLGESIDTSTPAGRLFYTMIAAMAQWEREEISSRVAASVPVRAKLGKALGGQAPFGYQWTEGKLIPHPDEAPVRALMYELFREHRRKKTVARLLNDRGYRTRNGSKFSDSTVYRLLQDPTAKGVRRANYTTSTNNAKAWSFKPEDEWVHTEVPAIIDAALWEECNAVLVQRKGTRPVARRVQHLFAGRTYCVCGGKMYVPSNSPKYTCQDCRTKIPTDDLEAIFHEQLRDFFCSGDEVLQHLRAFNERITSKEEELAVLSKEREKTITQMDRLYDLYQEGGIDARGFATRNKPLQERLAQVDDEIPERQAEVDFLKIAHLSHDDLLSHAQDLYTHWPNIPFEDRRRIVETIVDRIVIGKGQVDINLYYAPPLPQHNDAHLPPPEPPAPQGRGNTATKPHSFIAFLPVTLRASVADRRYPAEVVTLGDHLKVKRLDAGLTQDEVGRVLGVADETVLHWETGGTEPAVRFYPQIADFLGYCPWVSYATLGGRLRQARMFQGLSAAALAAKLKADEATVALWEADTAVPAAHHRLNLALFLGIRMDP